MRKKLALLFSAMLVAVTGYGQNAVMVNKSNGVITYPNNFWTANALQGRTGLGLGSAATNASTAFQPSSLTLSNLASSNAVNLTNIRATNIVGTIGSASNVTGIVAVVNGGTGATNESSARTNLGLGLSVLTNTNTTNFRAGLGLGWPAITNSNAATSLLGFTANGQVVANTGTNVLTVTNQMTIGDFTIIGSSLSGAGGGLDFSQGILYSGTGEWDLGGNNLSVSGTISFQNTTNSAATRTNLGLGWSALTNSNAATSLLGFTTNGQVVANTGTNVLTITNDTVVFQEGIVANKVKAPSADVVGIYSWDDNSKIVLDGNQIYVYTDIFGIHTPITFAGTNASLNTATTRTNLGLGWPALTNTNAGTSLVSVNSNGSVVSPTNFWQQAPIQTLVQTFIPIVNATNNGTNARNLYVYSMTPSVSGVTNTIVLPTNSATFDGDSATITHKGTTSTVTAVRQAGSATNLVTFNNTDESVKFIREAGQWTFYHNISYVEPIRFVDGGIESNKAESRTNLGLGWSALTNTNAATSLLGYTTNGAVVANTGTNMLTFTNSVSLSGVSGNDGILVWNPTDNEFYTEATFNGEIAFNNTTNAAATRTNLGLGLPALTNTSNTTFQQAIFTTNTPPTNAANVNSIGFNTAVSWMEIHIATNGTTQIFRIPLFK